MALIKAFLLGFVAILIISSCAGKLPPTDYDEQLRLIRLFQRAETFYGSLGSGRYEEVEKMAGPVIKPSFRSRNLKSIFEGSTIHVNAVVVDGMFEPFAVTRADVFYGLKDELPFYICEKMIWQYMNGDWYFIATRIDCRIELSKEDMSK